MDWPVTARTTIAHTRQTIVDRELECWLVVDLSPSMDFGTALSEKRELVLAAITAIVHLSVRGGNRVGAVVGNGQMTYRIPALPGRDHARYLLRRVANTERAASAGAVDLADLLTSMSRPQRRRGLIAVVSDFLENDPNGGPAPWERPLRALSQRHQLIGVEVLDPRELELPAAGLVTFADPETGRQLEVQTSSAELRAQYAVAAANQRDRIAVGLRRAGASQLQLRTDRDWVDDVVKFVLTRRRYPGLADPARGGTRPAPTRPTGVR
jgi:uncharacterized protein (DUF58 family)